MGAAAPGLFDDQGGADDEGYPGCDDEGEEDLLSL